MELRRYIRILAHRKWPILVTVAVTLGLAALGLWLTPPRYQATAVLRIGTSTRGEPDWIDYSLEYSTRLVSTYAALVASTDLQNEVAQQLHLEEPPEIRVETPANSELFIITAEHSDPEAAAQASNKVAELLIAYHREFAAESTRQFQELLAAQLAQFGAELDELQQELSRTQGNVPTTTAMEQQRWSAYGRLWEQYDLARVREAFQASAIVLIAPAATPLVPSSPDWKTYLTLSLLAGTIAGVGLALLLENFDTRIYSPEQIDSIPTLSLVGLIPPIRSKWNIELMNGPSPEAEAFRRLRTNLAMPGHAAPCGALMITSAESGEGKSTLAALLALAVAQTGSRVVLVDCDLRLPAQHRLFGLPNDVGLSTLLSGRSSLAETLQYDKATGVTLLPAGPRPSRPAELLASPRMADVIRCLKQQFDTVLVDAPALLAVADASILAHLMEQILLVVLSGQTREEAAHAAQEQLMLVQAQLSGIVLNRVRSSAERYWKHA